MTTESLEPNRRRGRARSSSTEVKLPDQKPFKQPRMRYEPTKVLSDDELESIHLASLRILSDYGMDFLDPDARELMKKAGAKVENERVRFDPEMVLETIKTCPSEFKLHARNPAHTLNIGGNWMAFGSVASTPNFIGLDGVRHPGTRADFQQLLKLTQVFNIIHFNSGYPVEPIDLHASIRHIETTYDLLTMTDKAIHCYSLGRQRNKDVLEMCRIARQVDDATLDREPSVFSIINSSSPLRLDTPMLQGELATQASIAGISQEQILRNAKKKLPLRRFIQADEVAAMVGYLVSPAASGVTAQSLMIDGGAGLGM